jgi:hypothetical protein
LSRLRKARDICIHRTAAKWASVAIGIDTIVFGFVAANELSVPDRPPHPYYDEQDISFEEEFAALERDVQKGKAIRRYISGLLKLHPSVEIPDYLLGGPWTREMEKQLFWIAQSGAGIDWVASTKGEVRSLNLCFLKIQMLC